MSDPSVHIGSLLFKLSPVLLHLEDLCLHIQFVVRNVWTSADTMSFISVQYIDLSLDALDVDLVSELFMVVLQSMVLKSKFFRELLLNIKVSVKQG